MARDLSNKLWRLIDEHVDFEHSLKILREAPRLLKPRPNTGKLWLDLLFIVFICVVQFSVLPRLFSGFLYVDLLTPWLVITMIVQKYMRALVYLVIAAILWETHSAAPAGTYLCAYLIVHNVIYQIKDPLSWHHLTPWLACTVGAQLFIVLFETAVNLLSRGAFNFDLNYILLSLTQTTISLIAASLLCRYWLQILRNEEREALGESYL